MRKSVAVSLSLLLLASSATARDAKLPPLTIPASGVIGVSAAQLAPDYWISRAADANAVLMTPTAIKAQNARVLARDPSMHELAKLPPKLDAATVRDWIQSLSKRPTRPLYDSDGKRVDSATIDGLMKSLAIAAIPASQPTRFGLVVRRAALRTFPTTLRVFRDRGDHDIDRFQESGIFPGTPVVIAHTSADGQWRFVVSPRYAAWIEVDAVAEGARATVLGYRERTPFRVITGDDVRTVFTPEQPAVSQLELDMGTRIPLATGLAPDQPVNGQSGYAAWTLALPIRDRNGSLAIVPALLPRVAASASDYLPLTRATIIREAFKFLGERYGWGHAYDGRDCSGFVSDVYASMGIVMPRNTSAQSVSPALEHIRFDADSSLAARNAAVATLDVGDLVYIPGHVMMVIGKANGRHYVINDVGGTTYHTPDGSLRHVKLNSVAVMPLEPQLFDHDTSYIERMTSIVHIHPRARHENH